MKSEINNGRKKNKKQIRKTNKQNNYSNNKKVSAHKKCRTFSQVVNRKKMLESTFLVKDFIRIINP